MTKSGKYLLTISAALFTILLWSCTQTRQPCLTPKRAILKIRTVLPAPDNKVTDTPLPRAVLVSLTGDSVLIATIYPKQSTYTLSLSHLYDSTQWKIASDTATGSKFDTLTFRYTRHLQFISNACGYTYNYILTSVHTTHNNIDSATITNTNVNNNANVNHIQVYYHR